MADEEMRRDQIDELRELLWAAALKNVCPKCGVDIDARCENLTERKHGRKKETRWPHPGRVPEPVRVEIYETLNLTAPDL